MIEMIPFFLGLTVINLIPLGFYFLYIKFNFTLLKYASVAAIILMLSYYIFAFVAVRLRNVDSSDEGTQITSIVLFFSAPVLLVELFYIGKKIF